jgi:hypothetical protein
MLLVWLSLGNEQLQSLLTEENASALYGLSTHFGIENLEQAIEEEQERREEADETRCKAGCPYITRWLATIW